MEQWKDTGESLGGYPCVSLGRGHNREWCISGPMGEIYTKSGTQCTLRGFKVVLFNLDKSEEARSFEIKDLQKWISRIMASPMRTAQARCANGFHRPLG